MLLISQKPERWANIATRKCTLMERKKNDTDFAKNYLP